MIHELRTYTVVPGKLAEAVKLSAEVGRRIREDRYGKLEGFWTTETGQLNQVVHLWSFADLNERARLRAALGQDKAWTTEFLPRALPMYVSQQNKILSNAVPLKPPAEGPNIYELRTYRTRVGRAAEFIERFKNALPVREKYSKNVCLWNTEIAQLNEVTHLWAYRSFNDRLQIRARALEDPQWQEFVAGGVPVLLEMYSTILIPTAFSPMR